MFGPPVNARFKYFPVKFGVVSKFSSDAIVIASLASTETCFSFSLFESL